MVKVHLITKDQTLVGALGLYKRFLDLPTEFVAYQKNAKLSLKTQDILLIHNAHPEDLRAFKFLINFKKRPATSVVPVIWLGEMGTEQLEGELREWDFVYRVALPFDSAQFINHLATAVRLVTSDQPYMQVRQRINQLIYDSIYKEAFDLVKKTAKKMVNNPAKYLMIAQLYHKLGMTQEALRYAKGAVKENPHSARSRKLLGSLYKKTGQDQLVKKIRARLELMAEPELDNAVYWGNNYLSLGQVEKAKKSYKMALEINPNDSRALVGMVAYALLEGDGDDIRAAIASMPKGFHVARACNQLGVSMANAGSFKLAEQLYRSAIQNIKRHGDEVHKLWLNLALCLRKKGDFEGALKHLAVAKETAPPSFKKVDAKVEETQLQIALFDIENSGLIQKEESSQDEEDIFAEDDSDHDGDIDMDIEEAEPIPDLEDLAESG